MSVLGLRLRGNGQFLLFLPVLHAAFGLCGVYVSLRWLFPEADQVPSARLDPASPAIPGPSSASAPVCPFL